MQILNKKAQNNNFGTIFSDFDKFQPFPLIFWGVTSVGDVVHARRSSVRLVVVSMPYGIGLKLVYYRKINSSTMDTFHIGHWYLEGLRG